MLQRKEHLVLIAALMSAMTLVICLAYGKGVIDSTVFSVLLGVLTFVCFMWWAEPLYNNPYDYFSPLAVFQSLSFIYMGVGNIIAFCDHEGMRGGGNPGADEYYNVILIAAIVGLIVFDYVYRLISSRLDERVIGYPMDRANIESYPLIFIRLNATLWYGIGFLVFAYMNSKYIKTGMVYARVEGEVDNILNLASPGLFFAAWATLSLLLFMDKKMRYKLVYWFALFSLLPILFSHASRTAALFAIGLSCVCYIIANPGRGISFKIVAIVSILFPAAYIALTGVKLALNYDVDLREYIMNRYGMHERFDAILRSPVFLSTVYLETGEALNYAREDSTIRVAGLEYPAAMQKAHSEDNVPYMFGEHNLVAAGMTVPRVIWPGKPIYDPKWFIDDHYNLWAVDDQLPTPIGSAFADGGMLGVLVGLPLLAIVLCLLQHWIWGLRDGLYIYLGSLGILAHYETHLASIPLNWLRLIVIIIAINYVVHSLLRMMYGSPRGSQHRGWAVKQL